MEYIPSWERDAFKRGFRIGFRRGFKKSYKKGMEIAEKKKVENAAMNLIRMGFDIDKVTEATELKKEEIEKLYSLAH